MRQSPLPTNTGHCLYTDPKTTQIIRSEALEDFALIEAITEAVFRDTPHANYNEQQTFSAMLDTQTLVNLN